MKTTVRVREQQFELALAKMERAEEDKFQPYEATVSGQRGGTVKGQFKLTDSALERAKEEPSEEEALARACGRSLAAEVVIRKLKPDFSFVVDHRWF
jgi:hypothetical protein